jgi:phosphate transport system substrate-binding protein
MRMRIGGAALWIGMALAMTGCQGDTQEPLLISGATSFTEYLKPVASAFMKESRSAQVVCEPGGTAAGIVALKHGAIDVAALDRDPMPYEDDDDMRHFMVARDGIAVVVHPSNPVENLALGQVRSIFSGSLRSWGVVGGSEGTIQVLGRDSKALSRKTFIELVLDGDDMVEGRPQVQTPEEMRAAVARDPLAIGFLALRFVSQEVKALHIDGVEMRRATLLSARYPLVRSFYLSLYKPSPIASRFVDFARGPIAGELLSEQGLIPLQ